MQMGFGKYKYFNFKQNFFEYISEVRIGSTNKETSLWLIGNWEIVMLL